MCDRFADLLVSTPSVAGEFSRIDSPVDFQAESLIFVSEPAQMFATDGELPAVVVTNKEIAVDLNDNELCVVVVKNVRLAQALIKQCYADYDASDPEWDALHQSAVIHTSAHLGTNVRIGANTVVGENVKIGDNTQVRANCVIESHVQIGNNCIINNLVNIGASCILHNRIILRPGVIIGSEGFSFGQDEQQHYHRTPHTGIVEIYDDVQIGVNGNIDRATYGKTVIGARCKN